MSESLLADLQYVQLIAKEQHRRKRRLTKLNKTKRQKILQESDHSRISEWHSNKHNKYKKAEWVLNIYLEYETKSIYNYDDNDNDIADEYAAMTTKTTTTTTTATVIINDINNNNKDEQYEGDKNLIATDISNEKAAKQDDTKPTEDTLSSYFKDIEHDFDAENISSLQFPLSFINHITSLYESSRSNDINGLLKSARSWNNEYGQVVVIGSYLDELVAIFQDMMMDYPMDIIYLISELVGNAIIWLRKPGLNIFKWSVKSTIMTHKQHKNERDRNKLNKAENIRKWKFKYKMSIFNPFNNNEFYFSGYIGNDTMKELLLLDCGDDTYLDLDWCFVAFLLLGLIPKYQNRYFQWYFNQKLLAALPGSYPFKLLLKK